MRILHILDHSIPLHSGYTFRTAAILREQRALGWETFHLTSEKQINCNVLEEEVDGLHFYRTPGKKGILGKMPGLNQVAVMQSLARRLREVIAIVKPDILHAHSPVLVALPSLRVGQVLGLPVVYEVRAFWEDAAADHGTAKEGSIRYRLTRAMETYAFKHADAVTCICEGLRRDIVGRGIPTSKVTVIPNAVDIEKFPLGSPPDDLLKASLGLAGTRVLGFIGSFYAYEGLNLLLEALPKILMQAPDVRVLLVGGGPQEANLRQQAKDIGIADKVVFAGRVPHSEVNRYYDLVDLLVYARLSMRLTELVTPLKPLEAMAQGQLFVASDVGGHKELVRNGETGWLFKSDNVDALTEGVISILNNQSRWPAIKAAGREYVENERSWKTSVSRYQAVYSLLLQGAYGR
jgi:PEP-CTERM/exosortase A-associated glycosyltransferase